MPTIPGKRARVQVSQYVNMFKLISRSSKAKCDEGPIMKIIVKYGPSPCLDGQGSRGMRRLQPLSGANEASVSEHFQPMRVRLPGQ